MMHILGHGELEDKILSFHAFGDDFLQFKKFRFNNLGTYAHQNTGIGGQEH